MAISSEGMRWAEPALRDWLLTPYLGNPLLRDASLPLAVIQGPPLSHRPPVELRLFPALFLHISATGSFPGNLPGRRRMGERRISGAG